jgi:hypothetical protein
MMLHRLAVTAALALAVAALAATHALANSAEVQHGPNISEEFAFVAFDPCHGELVAFEGTRSMRSILVKNDSIEGVARNTWNGHGTGVGLETAARYVLSEHYVDLHREQVEREPGQIEQQTIVLVLTYRWRRLGADPNASGDFYMHEHITLVVAGTGVEVVSRDIRTTTCR